MALVKYRGSFFARRRSPISVVLAAGAGNRTRDHRSASPVANRLLLLLHVLGLLPTVVVVVVVVVVVFITDDDVMIYHIVKSVVISADAFASP